MRMRAGLVVIRMIESSNEGQQDWGCRYAITGLWLNPQTKGVYWKRPVSRRESAASIWLRWGRDGIQHIGEGVLVVSVVLGTLFS